MALRILDETTAAAVHAAVTGTNGTREAGVADALADAFSGGNATLRIYSAADVLLRTVVLGPPTADTASAQKGVDFGAEVSETHAAAGTPSYATLAAGATVILRGSCGVGSGDFALLAAPASGVTILDTGVRLLVPEGIDASTSDPEWTSSVPTISFVSGVPSSVSVAQYVTDADGDPFTVRHNGVTLPTGVTWDADTLSFVYDGTETSGVTTGHVLTAGGLATLGLTATTTGTHPFCVGMVFPQGEFPDNVVADVATFQSTVLARWPDGSVKHVVLAGRTDFVAGQQLTLNLAPGPAASGANVAIADLRTALASTDYAEFSVAGVDVTLAALVGQDSTDRTVAGLTEQWVAGPHMSMWYACAPISGHLMLWCWVRMWATGEIEVFPWVENGFLGLASPGEVTGVAAHVWLTGSTPFTGTFTVKHHTRMPMVSGQRWSYWLDEIDHTVTPQHDTETIKRALLVPNVPVMTPAAAAWTAGYTESYTPNVGGNYTYSGGFQVQIGPLQQCHALHLMSGGDARAWRYTIVQALAANSHAYYYRDESTNDWPILSDISDYSLSYSGDGNVNPPAGTGGFNVLNNPAGSAAPESYRRGSMGYYAYLLTGDRFHLDTHRATVTWSFMEYSRGQRETTSLIFSRHKNIRNVAADLRDLGQLLAVMPSTMAGRADLITSWQNTIDYWHAHCVTGTRASGAWVNALGMPMFSGLESTTPYDSAQTTGRWWDAPWMANYWPVFLHHVRNAGPAQDATTAAKLDALLSFLFLHPVGIAGDPATGWDYRRPPYVVPYATDGVGQPPDAWMASWAAAYAAYKAGVFVRKGGAALSDVMSGSQIVYVVSGGDGASELQATASHIATYSGLADLISALACAEEFGATGATAARARMMAATNVAANLGAAWAATPVWAVEPRT